MTRTGGDSAVERMREATRAEHERTERAVVGRHFEDGMDRDGFRAFLEALLGFHRPVDSLLAPACRRHLEEYEYRGRTARLERDLRTLGLSDEALDDVETMCGRELPVPDAPERLLGCLYVVEGAELGGRVIWKQLRKILDDETLEADAFFGTGAGRARERWRRFGDVFDRHVTPGAPFEEALSAARATFRAYRGWVSS